MPFTSLILLMFLSSNLFGQRQTVLNNTIIKNNHPQSSASKSIEKYATIPFNTLFYQKGNSKKSTNAPSRDNITIHNKVTNKKSYNKGFNGNRQSTDTILYAPMPYYMGLPGITDSTADEDLLVSFYGGITESWLMYYEVDSLTSDTNYFLGATSFFTAPGQANNHYYFNNIPIPTYGAELSWEHFYYVNDFRDGYMLMISKDNQATWDTLVSFTDNDAGTDGDTTWTIQNTIIDSNIYGGQTVSILFLHNANNQSYINIDDIFITGVYENNVPVAYNSCDTIFHFDVPGFNIIDTNHCDGMFFIDGDSIPHHSSFTWVGAGYVSPHPSGYVLDTFTYDSTDQFLIFNSWFDTPSQADDYLGFGLTIPSNGGKFSWFHAYFDTLKRNGYGSWGLPAGLFYGFNDQPAIFLVPCKGSNKEIVSIKRAILKKLINGYFISSFFL